MIAGFHRFHGLNALRPVYARGQTSRGPLLAIRYIYNPRRSHYRAAVVVSRKVHKSAVVRNRIRRRIFEVLRQEQDAIQGPYDLIFTVYSEQAASIAAVELRNQIVSQLAKAGVTGVVQPVHGIVEK